MGLRERITLEPDPVWTERYETERERIREAAGDGLRGVFHVGSTAIPDLPGKPALDVIAVFQNEASMRAAGEALEARGYDREGDGADCRVVVDWREDHAVFAKLHVRDDERVRNQLAFREFLRDSPEARREYERVKREAARAHPEDPEAYTRAKTEVVQSLLERAREQGYADQLPESA